VGANVVGRRVGKLEGPAVVGEPVVGEAEGLSVGDLTARALAHCFLAYLHPVYVLHLDLVSPSHVPDAGRGGLATASTASATTSTVTASRIMCVRAREKRVCGTGASRKKKAAAVLP